MDNLGTSFFSTDVEVHKRTKYPYLDVSLLTDYILKGQKRIHTVL